MHLSSLIEMLESGLADRVLFGERIDGTSGRELGELVRSGTGSVEVSEAVLFVGENHSGLPVVAFATARAGRPFVPLNYRVDDSRLNWIIERHPGAGYVLPTVEIQVRDESGSPLSAGDTGLIFVREEQIAGEYESGSVLDSDGWFSTRDLGWLDVDGYLFIEGRADDTVIRGGDNIAPAEIEDVLLGHRDVREACVVGLPDEEWGERIVAVVVPAANASVIVAELRSLVRTELRGSKTSDYVEFQTERPYTETGKLLHRVVVHDLSTRRSSDGLIEEETCPSC